MDTRGPSIKKGLERGRDVPVRDTADATGRGAHLPAVLAQGPRQVLESNGQWASQPAIR